MSKELKEAFKKARGHKQIEELSIINRIIVRLLIRVTELIYNRLGATHVVGCVFYKKDTSPEARRKQMGIVKDE